MQEQVPIRIIKTSKNESRPKLFFGLLFSNVFASILTGLIFAGLFSAVVYVFAAYSPGATLDPTCSPGADGCTVTSPAVYSFGSNTFSGTGTGTFGNLQTGANGADGQLTIYSEQGTTDYSLIFQPNAAMTASTTYVWPAADGSSNQVLTTNGSGALSWSTASGGGAPTDATYITQTTNSTLSAEQALSSLSTGIMKVTTTTGVISSITDSAGIAGVISDETGSGLLVFATSPTLTTPNIGVATGTSLTLSTGGALQTGTTLGNTLLLQAYDTDTGPTYTTFATLTAGTTPTMDLATGVTIGTQYIYRVGGTDVAVADGGTGLSTVAAGSVLAANTLDTLSAITSTSGLKVLQNSDGTVSWASTTGTGNAVFATTPTLTTPVIGAATGTSLGLSTTANLLTLTNTNDNASVQTAILQGDRATMADNDEAYISLKLSNDGGTQTEFGRLSWVATDVNNGTSEDGRLDFAVLTAGSLTDELQLDGAALSPSTSDGLALGTSSLMFSDLYLASGGVIYFNNTDVTITHSANALDIDGGVVDFGSTPTVNGSAIYYTGGTDVSLADGGTGASLSDPNADKIMFWDDTAGAITWLGAGNSVAITDTTLDTIQDIRTTSSPTFANVTLSTGGALQTGTTLGNTLLLQAYDTDTGPTYTTFATLTAGTTPTMDLATGVTIGTQYIYRVGGTDVAVADGGTGKSSWTQWGIPYADTTTSLAQVAAGTQYQVFQSGGSGAPAWSTATYPATTTDNQVLYSSSANVIAGSANLTFDDTSLTAAGLIGPLKVSSTTGVNLTATNGILTMAGLKAAGNNENLTLDFETTANQVTIGTGTSVSAIGLGAINLVNTGLIGIGTTAPDKKLEINTGAATNGIRIAYNDADGSAATYSDFLVDSVGDLTVSVVPGSAGSSDIFFQTALQSAAASTKVTISSAGNVGIGTTSFPTGGGTPVLALGNATNNPTGMPANTAGLVNKSGELYSWDSAGNVTLISPHNFSLFQPEKDYILPWSFASENSSQDMKINVDMYGAIQAIEAVTGKQFIFAEKLSTGELIDRSLERDGAMGKLPFLENGKPAGVIGAVTQTISSVKNSLISLGITVVDGIASIKEVITETLTANKAEIKTATIEKLQMVDSETGETYCTWIKNGQWQKAKGSCDAEVQKSETGGSPTSPETTSPETTSPETPMPTATPVPEETPAITLTPTATPAPTEIPTPTPDVVLQLQEIVQQTQETVQSASQAAEQSKKAAEQAQQAALQASQEVLEKVNKAKKEVKEEVKEEVRAQVEEQVPEQVQQQIQEQLPEQVQQEVQEQIESQPSIIENASDAAAGLMDAMLKFVKWLWNPISKGVSNFSASLSSGLDVISAPLKEFWNFTLQVIQK